MPATIVKTLMRNPNERNHRNHRSKKNRTHKGNQWERIKDYKRKLEKLIQQDYGE